MNHTRQFIAVMAVCVFGLPAIHALGRGRNLKGTIVAYDPIFHAMKQASFVKNLEVTIIDLGTTGHPKRIVKVIFEGFGKSQLSQDVLDGEKLFEGRAVRDKSCDETHPRILGQIEPEQAFQGSGTFLLNRAHIAMSLGVVENLACYRVEIPLGEYTGSHK
jgi:hypothetical protein